MTGPTDGPADVWASFPHDPRLAGNAPLRASDADRGVVEQVLADAYADGRLDREEYDERSDRVLAARTLGELPDLVGDLVPQRPDASAHPDSHPESRSASHSASLELATPADLERRAQAAWATQRTEAVLAFVGASVICWIIWFFTGSTSFPWPLIVTAATGLNVLRTLATHRAFVDDELRRLEKKQAKVRRQGPRES